MYREAVQALAPSLAVIQEALPTLEPDGYRLMLLWLLQLDWLAKISDRRPATAGREARTR